MEKIITKIKEICPEQVFNYVEFWFFSGLRTSEIVGLRWEKVNLVDSSVTVNEVVVRGQRKDKTKTFVVRTVHLNSRALSALQRQRTQTGESGEAVFHDPRYGAPWLDERAFRRSYWTPTLKQLVIRYRRPYNMRHTYATLMLMAGMNSAFCARQLGHSVEVFHDKYAKWLDGDQNKREMALLENALIAPDLPQK
jgi:integrase